MLRYPSNHLPPVAAQPSDPLTRRSWALAVLLAAAVIASYWNSLGAPFFFDDVIAVTNNPTIRQFSTALTPPTAGGTTTGRPLLNFSFALNHAISGEAVWSYHATNILIHAGAALLLFGLARRTLAIVGRGLRTPPENAERRDTEIPPYTSTLAFVIALLWALHPLQTESVTSVAQRSESLCGMFYLLTLYTLARASSPRGPASLLAPFGKSASELAGPRNSAKAWLALSVLACLAGMATKEVMVTAPVLALLYDRTFLAGSFAEAWRRRRGYYAALAATWLLLAWLVLGIGGTRGPTAGLGLGVSSWQYLLTQCEALIIYLKLSLWPHPLVADYGTPIIESWTVVWWQGPVVLALLGGTLWALWRRPVLGFVGAWFFLILAPSSSIVPLVSQTIAEHRMYLPLAAVVALLIGWAATRVAPRWLLVAGVILGLVAGVATHQRNAMYLDEQTMWEDVIAHRPENGRAHNNLGRTHHQRGRYDLAITSFQRAIGLEPANPFNHFNLGLALLQTGRLIEAEAALTTAVRHEPSFFYAHQNLGVVLTKLDRAQEALGHFAVAQRYAPWSADIHFQWGVALARLGRHAEAITHYAECVRLDPQHVEAQSNWGTALLELRAMPEAITHFEAALRLRPDAAGIHFNLGLAYMTLARSTEALTHYREAVRLDPDHALARLNLGIALAQAGRLTEALDHLEAAARLQPDEANIHTNLGVALALAGRPADALASYQNALRLTPSDAQAHYNVGYALLEAGRLKEALPYFETAVRLQPGFTAGEEILQQVRERAPR